ncbi:cytochrome P450 [Dactylosporangium sp. McL0621]|uniref:cytochrome P450 n=1 Tax=Dactylosporangium sp. McL0621 TaxID=3415678 RepID=UPI003CEFAD84
MTDPVAWDGRLRRFIVSGHAEVVAVLQDPATFSSAVAPAVPAADRARLADFGAWSARWLFFLDPPEHTARRAPLARALAPHAIAPLAGPITELARDLAARLPGAGSDALADSAHPPPGTGSDALADSAHPPPGAGSDALADSAHPPPGAGSDALTDSAHPLPGAGFDALADFAHPLAARVIAGLLCAPGPPTEAFLARARILEHADAYARDADARRAGLDAIASITPGSFSDDAPIPSALRAAWGAADGHVPAHSVMLLFAGVETTQNLIVNTLHALLSRGLWPAPAAGAVEEGARFAPPVLGVLRRATRDAELAGRAIPAGAELVAMTAAANRDPARFADPDRFDVYRRPNPHLSFGLGRHYCPGAELSRLTARAALTALLGAFPRLELAEPDPPWRDHDPIIRAPKRLLSRRPSGTPGSSRPTGPRPSGGTTP